MENNNNQNLIVFWCAVLAGSAIFSYFSATLVFAFLFISAVLYFSIKKIEIAVFLLSVYIPFEPFILKFSSDEIYPLLRYGTEIALLLLFVIVIGRKIKSKEFKYIHTPIDFLLLLFFVISLSSAIINTDNPLYLIFGLRQLFRYLIVYYIIVYSNIPRESIKKLFYIMFFVLFIQAAIGFSQFLIGAPADALLLPGENRGFESVISPDYVYQFWSSGQRVFSTMGRYDRLGIFICFFLLFLFGFWYQERNKDKRKIFAILFLISLPTLLFTYSRMSWIGLALGVLFIGVVVKRSKKIIKTLVVGLIILIAYFILYVFSNSVIVSKISDQSNMDVQSRVLSLFSAYELKNSYRSYGRLYFIVNTPLKVVSNYPFFGVGLGQYGSGVAYFLHNTKITDELGMPFGIENSTGQIDNNWFSIWGETGTLGFLVFISMMIALLKTASNLYKNSNDSITQSIALGYMGAIVAISFQAFLGPYFEVRTSSYYLWLTSGVIVRLFLINQDGEKKYVSEKK